MSPAAAMQSEIFRFWVAALVGALVLAGVLLLVLRHLFKREIGHAWGAYCGWLVMVPLVLAAIYLGRVAVIVFFTLVALLGFKEFVRATGLYRDWLVTSVVYAGITAVGITCVVQDPSYHTPGWYGLFVAMPAFVIAAILMVPILRNRSKGQLQVTALAILGFIYIGWMFSHLSFLANAGQAYACLLYLIVAVQLNDVAAFTSGKLFGRRPLCSNISPNKTWEGAIGAAMFSMALPWLIGGFALPGFGPRELILTGLIVGVGGQLGDLSISVIKRDLGIKDTGAIIRGHGGILDRIDSLIYASPLFFHMAHYYVGLD